MSNNIFQKCKFEFDTEGQLVFCLVPTHVANCPCCESQLYLEVTSGEWDENLDLFFPDEISPDCTRPKCFRENINAPEWRMPYVYWLPLENKCQEWLTKMLFIYYNVEPVPQWWLEENGQTRLFER